MATPSPAGYKAAHKAVRDAKGRASDYACVDCGGQATDWSRDNDAPIDTHDLDHYAARCRRCHVRHDNAWHHARNESRRRRDNRTGTDDYTSFVLRLIRSYGRKAREGDLDTTSLTQLADIQAALDEQTLEVVRALRSEAGGSYSWTDIGNALGITRGAALRRYGAADTDARRVGGQPAKLR